MHTVDVVKTRVQGQLLFPHPDTAPLLQGNTAVLENRRGIGALEMTRAIYGSEGWRGFFRGLGVCSARAFVVNAVQWAVYEWVMRRLT
ncbi:MAG: hypothetical protein M1825_000044 [Sarcosagium campestre]|nr:MAG: hypothetical protein M1825_000044 [Sarcosagium campestre]